MSNMVVQTNMLALNAHRSMGLTGNAQARASARLSSGFRINSAADDAAGLAISETMRAQIRGLDQASRNAQDGISLIQVAEGALNTINAMMIRARELTVQASNDTYTAGDREKLWLEVNQLLDEVYDTFARVEFNTMTLLDGTLSDLHLQIGANTSNGTTVEWSFIGNIMGRSVDGTWPVSGAVDGRTSISDGTAGWVGTDASGSWTRDSVAISNMLYMLTSNIGAGTEHDLRGLMRVVFTDGSGAAAEATHFADFGASRAAAIVALNSAMADPVFGWATGNVIDGASITTAGELIAETIQIFDRALDHITSSRAQMGAWMNRLEYTIENLDLASENLAAANSRIRDADMAREMMRFTQTNVLQQAAISMLAQANMAPQNILQLLR